MTKAKPTAKVQANQYQVDPRQSLFLGYYLDPSSETFSNGYKSALKAGYSEEYAKIITAEKKINWLSETLKDDYKLKLAEDNLVEFLTMVTNNHGFNKSGEEYFFNDAALQRIKADVTKFVLERLNKVKYAVRTEVTGKGGKGLVDVNDTPTLKTILQTAEYLLLHAQTSNTTPSKKK